MEIIRRKEERAAAPHDVVRVLTLVVLHTCRAAHCIPALSWATPPVPGTPSPLYATDHACLRNYETAGLTDYVD